MSFKPQDWSELSYREVKAMLEEYRENYKPKEKDLGASNAKFVDETK